MTVTSAILVLLAMLYFSIPSCHGSTVYQAAGISRHQEGDTFLLRRDGVAVTCSSTLCADSRASPAMMPALSSGTQQCTCRCPPELPVFREDLHVCVDDIHECSLATFKNGAKTQKVPFVFLPMKGQIIHPSSDIIFSDDAGEGPICVVSHAQFLTRSGWLELRNTSDTEPPLRLFRDQRRTFLQWLGEQDLRLGMEGRILLARLMCKDPNEHDNTPLSTSGVVSHSFSTPCVAFRVAGVQGAGEVMFTSDYNMAGSGSLLHGVLSTDSLAPTGLSTSEGVAVGICVLLLGLVYAASVCVYIYVRRRKKKRKKRGGEHDDSSDSERGGHMGLSNGDLDILGGGVVKNNPLLMSSRDHYMSRGTASGFMHNSRRSLRGGDFCDETPNQGGTGGVVGSSEDDDDHIPESSEHSGHSDERNKINSIKALVHPECNSPHSSQHGSPTGGRNCHDNNQSGSSGIYTLTLQPAAEGGSMERHPEESVSIVETLDEATSYSRSRDFSFLGRHTMGSSALGLPGCGNDGNVGCRGISSGSSNHSGPFFAAPGTAMRRKLYFNPAYFEPEMLQSPPPAALEFLSKLREVITMSKHKMASKRFAPSLLGIPEEMDSVISSRTSQSLQGYTNTKRSWAGSHPHRSCEAATTKPCLLPDDVTGSKQQTIRRWLEDLESGDPVEEEEIETNDEDSTPQVSLQHEEESPAVTPQPKKLMDAVIKELVRERGLTPGESSSSDETVNQNMKNMIRKINDENDYELVSMQPTVSPQPSASTAPSSPISRPPLMMYCLPELLAKTNGYNLVSEVYVNDGYSCSSNQSTTSSGDSVQKQRHRKPKGSIESSEPSSHSSLQSENHEQENLAADDPEVSNYPGSLTIKLSDSPSHQYKERKNDETDGFEPDTLDRIKRIREVKKHEDICADSLERPMKILLKSSGSFYTDAVMNENLNQPVWRSPKEIWQRIDYSDKKKRSPSSIADLRSTNISFASTLNRNKEFGSLREIFEAKRQQQLQKQIQDMLSMPASQNVNNANIINNNNNNTVKRGATRSLIEPNELKFRYGLNPQMIDEIRDLMWRSTPEAVNPLPRLPSNKPKRQRSADITSSPPTPPPPVPPSNPPSNPPSLTPSLNSSGPPSLPPKQRNKVVARPHHHPPLPPRDVKPPPSLPPKNLRGSRSPRILPNLVTSHNVPASGASAGSDYDEDEAERQEGSCTLGRKVENCLNDAFSTWGKQRNKIWEAEVKITHRPGDSGYLSSDSNNSLKRESSSCRAVDDDDDGKGESSETEESLCDGGSESGAESIGTDSFFFGRVRPQESSSPELRHEASHVTSVVPVLLNAGKKKPPPPPKRINSKLENERLANSDTIIKNIHSKYGL